VDSVPDSLLLIKSGGAGNRTRASGSVAKKTKDVYPVILSVVHHAQNPLDSTLATCCLPPTPHVHVLVSCNTLSRLLVTYSLWFGLLGNC
jgi:hypothetical protein